MPFLPMQDKPVILFLGDSNNAVAQFLEQSGYHMQYLTEPLSRENLPAGTEWVISYGYRHIIRKWTLDLFPQRVINLHISLLPWNRGADPNLWSFLENTPKGVSIHLVDEGLDTGPVLVQKEVEFAAEENTLALTYQRLKTEIEDLFVSSWDAIRSGDLRPEPQTGGGSNHRMAQKEPFLHLLEKGWDTPISSISGAALINS